MQFRLNMTCDNAAFGEDYFSRQQEIARILHQVAAHIADGHDISHFLTIFDANGNDVGRYALKDESYFTS